MSQDAAGSLYFRAPSKVEVDVPAAQFPFKTQPKKAFAKKKTKDGTLQSGSRFSFLVSLQQKHTHAHTKRGIYRLKNTGPSTHPPTHPPNPRPGAHLGAQAPPTLQALGGTSRLRDPRPKPTRPEADAASRKRRRVRWVKWISLDTQQNWKSNSGPTYGKLFVMLKFGNHCLKTQKK